MADQTLIKGNASASDSSAVRLVAQDFEAALHNSPIATAVFCRSGQISYHNTAWADQGWTDHLSTFKSADLGQVKKVRETFCKVLRGHKANEQVSTIVQGDGKLRYARWYLSPWRMKDGVAEGAILYIRDITSEIEAQEFADDGRAFLDGILNNIDEAIIAADSEGNTKYINAKLLEFQSKEGMNKDGIPFVETFEVYDENGKTPLPIEQYPLSLALENKRVYKRRMVFKVSDGNLKHVEASAQKIISNTGAGKGAVVSMHEITDRIERERKLKRSEAEARRIAYSDPMTGFPNRASLQRTLSQDPQTLCKAGEKLLILSADIHRFKAINDIHGHDIGDRLLAEVADRLADIAGPRTIVGRLAGDEFLIIAPVSPEAPLEIADKISHFMDGLHVVDGHRMNVQMMLGAAIWPDDGSTGDQLLSRADMARRYAKKHAVLTLKRFDPELEAEAQRKRQIEHDLRRTIQNDGLDVAYQAIVDAQSGKTLGFEALCRWQHPQHGFIAPDQFIAVAEQTGDILDLGEWMFRRVMHDLADYPDLFVAINVSPMQFNDVQFVSRLKDALVEFDFDPSRLELEVTENLVVEDHERVLAQVRELQAMGIGIALDDFGTGYSSLAYLQTYKFDKLKVDRSFVNKLGQDREALALMQSIIQIGKSLNMSVVAEGVETEGQALMLRHAGCDYFQGYFYAKPEAWDNVREKFDLAPAQQDRLEQAQRLKLRQA